MERLAEVGDFVDEIVSEIPPGLEYVGLENIESGAGDYSHAEEKDGISAARVFRAGQVLFSRLRPYLNKVALAKSGGVCSTEIYAIQARALRPEYLAAFLRSDIVLSQTEYMMTGATLPRLQLADVKDLLIPILSEREQNRIIRVIEAARAKKEKAARQARELLAQADDFLLSELGVEMPAADRGAKVFYRRFSELSGNRLDPFYYRDDAMLVEKAIAGANCSVEPVSAFCRVIADKPPEFEGEKRYYSTKVIDSFGNAESFDMVDYLNRPSRANIFPQKDDVGFAVMDKTAKTVLIDDRYEGAIFSTGFCFLRPLPRVLSEYLFLLVGSDFFQRSKDALASGAIMGGIRKRDIEKMRLPIPPLATQKKIVAGVFALRKRADAIRRDAEEKLHRAKREVEAAILGG